MSLVIKDRIKETTTTTGAGTATLLGAEDKFLAFSEVGDGNTTPYAIVHRTANEWEVGIGTYTASGTTLTRTTVLASSNGGSAVNFSAGTKDVFVTLPAEKITVSGPITTSGLTMSTARILGRTTASTGAVEEIGVGTGLALSGGSLVNSAPAVAVAAGDVLQVVTATDAGSTTTSTGLTSMNAADKSITPKNSASKILIEVSFLASVEPISAVNATGSFQLYDVTGAAAVGAVYTINSLSGPGGSGAYAPAVVRAIVSNSVLTSRAFRMRGATNNASGAAGCRDMVWSFTEIKT